MEEDRLRLRVKRLRKYRSYFEPDEDFAVPYTTKVRLEDRAGSTVNFDSDSTNSTFELEGGQNSDSDSSQFTSCSDEESDAGSPPSSVTSIPCGEVFGTYTHTKENGENNGDHSLSDVADEVNCKQPVESGLCSDSEETAFHFAYHEENGENDGDHPLSDVADEVNCKQPVESGLCSDSEQTAFHFAYCEEHVSDDCAGNSETSESEEEQENNSDLSDEEQQDVLGLFGHDETMNDTLCPGIGTTKAEALLLVMTFAMRHCLTSVGLIQLLQLINQLIGQPALVATKHLFQKVFHSRSMSIAFQFYCKTCLSFVCTFQSNDLDTYPCPNCDTPCNVRNLNGDNFFITSNVSDQLKGLLGMPNINRHLGYRFNRQKVVESNLEDIYDGEVYKELSKEGRPLSTTDNLSYSFNSDGVPIFSSSKYSLWPIFLMINELPPKLRRDNLILAGIWCGKSKTKMDVFLQKFVEEAQRLALDGVNWIKNGVEVKSKIFGLCCCVDAPARAAMQNTVQFNGYYGCSLCYHPGKVHSGVIKYPVDVAEYSDRNDEEMLADMLTATEEARSVRGVKGPTPLVNIPHFPVVWGFPPDFMHCCLLGVSRQLAELWFGSSSGEAFYIGSPAKIGLVDKRLASIKPPSIISRVPRPVSERKYWKASEWYNWLLFFCLPCLLDVLPQPYLLHVSIFVRAMFLLLQKSISNEDGNMADLLMTSFVCKFQLLYGTSSMTFNVHSLTHLAKSVKKWGPLWTHSCFPFELCNGQIKKYLCGNKGIALQAMHKFMLLKALPLYGHIFNVSERVTSHCNEMLGITGKLKGMEIDGVQLLGNPVCVQLSDEKRFALTSNGFIVDENVESFCRLKKDGFTFHTYTYSRATVRSDKYFCLLDGSCGELHHIIIHNGQCLILYKEVLLGNAIEFDDQELGMSVGHIKRWIGTQEYFQVGPAHHLSSSCVIVPLFNRSYVCFLPNHCVL